MNSGCLFSFIWHLREDAGSVILKKPRVFREHITAKFQVFLSFIHVMVTKINGQEWHGVIDRVPVFICLRKRMDGKVMPEAVETLASGMGFPRHIQIGFQQELPEPRCTETFRHGRAVLLNRWEQAAFRLHPNRQDNAILFQHIG